MSNKTISKNILDSIGNTPIIRLNNEKWGIKKEIGIYAKFEGLNPSGSIKDRIAKEMIEDAEKQGKLKKGMTIIEATSGNTGISLAMIGAVKGYNVEIAMSSAVSVERRKIIEAFGAKVIITDGNLGTDGAIIKVKELVKNNPEKYYHTDQFSNNNNLMAHYKKTGEEIWQQMDGDIQYFASALGTSGTLMGVSKVLKEKNPNITIIEAHPVKGHYIQGLKNMEEAIIPKIYDINKIDISIKVESEQAIQIARDIISKEGIFVGMSSGAALYTALEVAKKINKGNIITIFPDRGEKYLSTNMFR
jgi:S-sulfo-L-cysteine synthase (O-acetyl-L-serine-dependent)